MEAETFMCFIYLGINLMVQCDDCLDCVDVCCEQQRCEAAEKTRTSLDRLSTEPCVASSTPNSGSGKARPRIVKPSTTGTSPNDQHSSPDLVCPKVIRGKRKSLTGRLPSSDSPKSAPTQQTRRSPPVSSPRSTPTTTLAKNSPQGARKSAPGSVPSCSPGGRRRSSTSEKTAVGSPVSTSRSEGARRSVPSSPATPRGSLHATTGGKSPRSSPRVTRTPQTTPKSGARQPAAVSQKSSPTSEQCVPQPRPLLKEGTFTKEPSPSVESVTVDRPAIETLDTSESNSDFKEKNAVGQALASSSELPQNTASEQPSSRCTEIDSLNKANSADVSGENNSTITADYIASLLLGDKALGSSKLTSSGASRSVGNLMAINSSSRPTSPRSGPATPTVGRKSIDSQLTEIAAAASKKPARNKISSLWHRDKPSKVETNNSVVTAVNKNGAVPLVQSKQSGTVSDSKDKCRDGLGKSPRSFRKSFPLRKSKKTAEKSEPAAETKFTRSDTYDMIESEQKSVQQSAVSDASLSLTAVGETQVASPASADMSSILHSSLDDVTDTSTQPGASKGFKGLNIFRRFAKESKDKSKDDRSAELSKSEVGPTKRKGFSLWRRDHSAGRKGKSRELVVKSATMPLDGLASTSAAERGESLSPPGVPLSATSDGLVSAGTPWSFSDSSASPRGTEMSSDSGAVDRSSEPSPEGPSPLSGSSRSVNPSSEVLSDTDADHPRRRINCTSIVTTV